jgi:hypothetical protein
MWDYAVRDFRVIAGLSPSLGALAARLRLHTERSWEDGLGEVDAAMLSIRKIHFALSQTEGTSVKVWVSQDQIDVDAALDVLLEALGIGRDALSYYLDPETGIFIDLRADPEVTLLLPADNPDIPGSRPRRAECHRDLGPPNAGIGGDLPDLRNAK